MQKSAERRSNLCIGYGKSGQTAGCINMLLLCDFGACTIDEMNSFSHYSAYHSPKLCLTKLFLIVSAASRQRLETSHAFCHIYCTKLVHVEPAFDKAQFFSTGPSCIYNECAKIAVQG